MTAATAPTKLRPKPNNRFLRVVRSPAFARILFPFAVLAVWWLIYYTLNSRIFPPPQQVLSFMWDEVTLDSVLRYGSVRSNVYGMFAISLARLGIGFVIAMFLGTIIGLAMGLSKSIDAFFHDWIMAILAMPALVWALFLGLALGFGHVGPVIAVALTGLPFVIINVREGVRNTPKELFDMARSFQVPQKRIIQHVLMPSLMPFMFAAARYGFSIGWKGLVITEVFASDEGAGWTIKFWYDAHRAHGVIGYALFFILFALFLERTIFERLEKRAFKWRPGLHAVGVVEQAFEDFQTEDGYGPQALASAEAAASDFDDGGGNPRG
ncbi:MAG TPA: ABC transporter permease subunit [Acidimicrobiia bacterium]|nr:ABC transporter permease subunit [Acidimicrobiia bacterium]